MARVNNYVIQVRQAQERFLAYDQEALIAKGRLEADRDYLYLPMFSQRYRIDRRTGSTEKETPEGWADANTHGEVMTLLDFVCDCHPDRHIQGRWKNMADFGLLFHSKLLETARDPWAEKFEADPEGFRRACLALNGRPLSIGDLAYAIELFDGLEMVLQLWFGDEEFPAALRFLWDENALMYLKYETMYFAKGLLLEKISEKM